MIRGYDLSKYNSTEAVRPDFVILNVEDPYLQSKVQRAHDLGIPWDAYKWCYAGQTGQAMCDRTHALVDAVFPGGRYPAFWLDYEDAGVTGGQVGEWFAACDRAGVKSGWYCYLYLLNGQGNHAPDRPLWLAYYPGQNDGTYIPSMSDTARQKGALLHQYTSTAGRLDQNVVLDESWWAGWIGDDDMTPDEVNQLIESYVFQPTELTGVSRVNASIEDYVFAAHDPYPSRFFAAFIDTCKGAPRLIKQLLGLL